MAKEPYAKPALTFDAQLELLKGRGLSVADDDAANQYLANISYYRLSGYTRYFSRDDDERHELFRDGVSFDDVIALYVFDRRVRHLLSEAFERIEIAIKASLAYHGSVISSPFWITDPAMFDAGRHADVIALVLDATKANGGRHKQQFLDHFYRKYSDNYPPAWMVTEVLSFHGASVIFKLARGSVRKPVADQFGVNQEVLESWLHALVFARNVCAHHQRFWNRKFTISPKIPHQYRGAWPDVYKNRLYVTCCIAKHLLARIRGDTTWPERLRLLINERPNVPLAQMGFPEDWETSPYWGF